MALIDGVSRAKMKVFEITQDIVLPENYKKWLELSDGGELFLPAGIQLYGIDHKPLIDVNDSDRPSDEYVVIGALATGDPIIFKKGSEEVAIYNHEAGIIEDDEIYENFFSFLNDLPNLLGIGV